MIAGLRRGFFFCVKGRLVFLGPAGRTTLWISVELMRRVTSALEILEAGRLETKPDIVGQRGTTGMGWVNDSQNIHVVLLESGGLVLGAEDLVEHAEGALGPDAEAAEVATRSEGEDVQVAHVAAVDAGHVLEGAGEAVVLSVDDQGTGALGGSAVAALAGTGAGLGAVVDLADVGVGGEGLEEGDGLLGLEDVLDLVGDNAGNLLNLFNAVTAGEDEGRKGGSGNSRDDSVATLVLVGLDVPAAPGAGGSEHATAAAHVTESSL